MDSLTTTQLHLEVMRLRRRERKLEQQIAAHELLMRTKDKDAAGLKKLCAEAGAALVDLGAGGTELAARLKRVHLYDAT